MRRNEDAAEPFLAGDHLPVAALFLIHFVDVPYVGLGVASVGIACVAYIATMVLVWRHPQEIA